MPGTGIPDFSQYAKVISRNWLYGLGIHHDRTLRPLVLGHCDIVGRQGLTIFSEKPLVLVLRCTTFFPAIGGLPEGSVGRGLIPLVW